MSRSNRRKSLLASVSVGLLAIAVGTVYTQDEQKPTNDAPNPYHSTEKWGKLPPGRTWGALNAVGIDKDGESVWVADRCGANPETPPGASPFAYDSCAGSLLNPIMKFDKDGNLVRSFGAGMFLFPHKVYVDRDGNLWVADQRGPNQREAAKYPNEKKGHIVVKFSPEGKVLFTIGTPGVAGNPPEALTEPTSIVMAPNGNVYISEGHTQGDNSPATTVARIDVFTKEGKYIKSFGKYGTGPGEFRGPHDLAMDSAARLFVADRGNMRVQILDQDGKFIAEWKQFSRPSGIFIRNDMLYVADSESNGVAPHPGWKRGTRIGSVKDGKVVAFIPDPREMMGTSAAEGMAVDAKGNVYGGEVGPQQVARHSKQ